MSRSRPLTGRADTRGEALTVAIFVLGGDLHHPDRVHAMAAATARTAVQAAADAADGAAQIAAPGDRADEGAPAARIASAAARSPIIKTRPPAAAEPERGQVQVLAFGGIISPAFGRGVEFSARARGPLDDIATSALSRAAAWQR